MGDIIDIHQQKIFTLDEAKKILPVVRRLTANTSAAVEQLVTQLNIVKSQERKDQIQQEIRDDIQGWYEKLRKLGCESKGLWLVDFDNGEGYYCWRYPEVELEYFHPYTEGFKSRVKLH